MRTTVDIEDGLYVRLRAHAAREHTSVKKLLNLGAVLVMKQEEEGAPGKIDFPVLRSKSKEPLPVTHENIYDFIDFP